MQSFIGITQWAEVSGSAVSSRFQIEAFAVASREAKASPAPSQNWVDGFSSLNSPETEVLPEFMTPCCGSGYWG